jgi:hypothetical protein
MSRYNANYGPHLGSQKCCDLRGRGTQGITGPTGISAIGERGYTGPTSDSVTGPTGRNCIGNTGPTGPAGPNTKTFVIEHPLDSSKYLVHSCLEGPEAGVYYRGTSRITNKNDVEIELPFYVSAIAYDFTVNLTPIYDGKRHLLSADGKRRSLSTSLVENNKFKVYGDNCEFFWIVYGKRFNIIVEPYKNDVTVKGDGPYLYI